MLYFIGMIVICAYVAIIVGSIILLILKVIERKKEKQEEDWDKYDDY
ncbi:MULTISPECIES: hypothetical protein [Paraclostridium]|uniref:Uncharacterized protein n=2 Tax=Paraclostridium bifermentans TaxID=1490 RepID=T4VR69_PARBF|nr:MULTISPECIES: hypothetical protein [Paraclostridium]EQK39099.1 hypothetical protein C671_3179 [[Clostridium] bifermentans ATCC 19299] [Paraclostridium bifermentans ATCC 19299]EQK43261.1 hypothetical protein C672_2205 [[Clostridium] bifermentans ATCC 638] [Paraclostridium bifermentans ATCC 638 = DSM 14991]MBN8047600.1 hypothetical protein [Paraclostridium bifermentans]MBS6507840.1 hypothetical protein [Paraclostridium bifermentans]MBZ6004298.1 hypothetical protein [Paraclostridium bifermenta